MFAANRRDSQEAWFVVRARRRKDKPFIAPHLLRFVEIDPVLDLVRSAFVRIVIVAPHRGVSQGSCMDKDI